MSVIVERAARWNVGWSVARICASGAAAECARFVVRWLCARSRPCERERRPCARRPFVEASAGRALFVHSCARRHAARKCGARVAPPLARRRAGSPASVRRENPARAPVRILAVWPCYVPGFFFAVRIRREFARRGAGALIESRAGPNGSAHAPAIGFPPRGFVGAFGPAPAPRAAPAVPWLPPRPPAPAPPFGGGAPNHPGGIARRSRPHPPRNDGPASDTARKSLPTPPGWGQIWPIGPPHGSRPGVGRPRLGFPHVSNRTPPCTPPGLYSFRKLYFHT